LSRDQLSASYLSEDKKDKEYFFHSLFALRKIFGRGVQASNPEIPQK
jgi:hypothetical protein